MVDISKYEPLTELIIGAAIEVHTSLGCGFPERIYQKALQSEFARSRINFLSKPKFSVTYKGTVMGIFEPDFIVFDNIIVELKALEETNNKQIQQQMLSYMAATEFEIALLLNFGKASLEIKRYIIPEKFQKQQAK